MFWQSALDVLESPVRIAPLTGEAFEELSTRRMGMLTLHVAAFDIIAVAFEERFGAVSQRMETELL